MSEALDSTVVDMGDGDMVLLPVPRRFYPLMVHTLGNAFAAEGGGQVPPVPVGPEGPSEENYRGWTRDRVRRLKEETHIPSLLALFDLTEKKDGEPVGIAEIEQATGKTVGPIRGDLIKVTKFANNELGLNTWPFWTETGPDGRAQYRVPQNVRRWWAEA